MSCPSSNRCCSARRSDGAAGGAAPGLPGHSSRRARSPHVCPDRRAVAASGTQRRLARQPQRRSRWRRGRARPPAAGGRGRLPRRVDAKRRCAARTRTSARAGRTRRIAAAGPSGRGLAGRLPGGVAPSSDTSAPASIAERCQIDSLVCRRCDRTASEPRLVVTAPTIVAASIVMAAARCGVSAFPAAGARAPPTSLPDESTQRGVYRQGSAPCDSR